MASDPEIMEATLKILQAAGAEVEIEQQVNGAGLDIIKTENLYYFDGQPGFTAAQGQ